MCITIHVERMICNNQELEDIIREQIQKIWFVVHVLENNCVIGVSE